MRTTTNYNEEGVKILNYNIKFPETDLPAFETLFKKYNVEVAPIDEEDDFYYELSAEELQKIEKAREQSRLGMTVSSEELHRELRERYGSKMELRG